MRCKSDRRSVSACRRPGYAVEPRASPAAMLRGWPRGCQEPCRTLSRRTPCSRRRRSVPPGAAFPYHLSSALGVMSGLQASGEVELRKHGEAAPAVQDYGASRHEIERGRAQEGDDLRDLGLGDEAL